MNVLKNINIIYNEVLMKKPITLFVLFYLFLVFGSTAISQTKQWKDYTRGNNVTVLAEQNNNLWIGTYGGGLTEYNESNGTKTFFSKDNSKLESALKTIYL